MRNFLKSSSLIKVAVIMVVMAFMASQVTDTYARGWGKSKGTSGGGYNHKCEKDEGNNENGECATCCDAWDKLLTDDRFVLVMDNDEGVLDNETCLVWEQSPSSETVTWTSALGHCFQKKVGGRKGWRAPTIEELATLVDDTQGPPTLPSGHPFDTDAVQSSFYWSSSTFAFSDTDAWGVGIGNGVVGRSSKDILRHVWCVRGGQGHDAY